MNYISIFSLIHHSRPERIAPIAERFGLDKDATLDNIVFARAYTHEHQLQLITGKFFDSPFKSIEYILILSVSILSTEIAAKMVEDQYRLLIVDSITALFRVDFSGRGELAERQQRLGHMLR